MSSSEFDAVVIGAGPGGRGAAKRLVQAGRSVAMVEQELVGGECPFWACIPTKTLLRPAEAIGELRHVAGLDAQAARWDEVRAYRDYMNSGLDDAKKAEAYASMGIEIVRGHARITGPGAVDVDGRALTARHLVIATGTDPAIPPVDGIADVEYWTNREATTLTEVPGSAIVLGGGPVGVELGQMLARYGARVTIVEAAERLLSRETASVGEQLAELLAAEDAIDVRTGAQAVAVERDGAGVAVTLHGGDRLCAQRLVVAVGRRPRVVGIGLDAVGIEPGERGIEVDEHCRAADGVWAVGDVTGIAPFTHVAGYQARIACADILDAGRRPADYKAMPRVVFSDPEVAAVGLTPEQAGERGLATATATVDLSEADRTETYGKGLAGHLGVLADRDREVLVGAWAVGPLASEVIHSLVVAVNAQVPLAILRDTTPQFPTFSELVQTAVEKL
ncbi:MAG: dihydrolipoyl dehydrogenase family protein [Solirubrobacteraceae bacterium]